MYENPAGIRRGTPHTCLPGQEGKRYKRYYSLIQESYCTLKIKSPIVRKVRKIKIMLIYLYTSMSPIPVREGAAARLVGKKRRK